MPRLKKERPDEKDLEILAALYYLGEATASDLEKLAEKLNLETKGAFESFYLSKASISDRLKWLTERGYLTEPEMDITTGRLRKVYKAPNKEVLKELVLDWYRREIYEPITEEFVVSVEEGYTAYKDYPPEKVYEDDRAETLTLESAKNLKKLRKGTTPEEAAKIFESFSELFGYEMAGLIAVENGTVKLTEKGLKTVISNWTKEITEKLKELKELDEETFRKILSHFC